MADVKAKIRNKFNVDEELESPFDIKQLKRASTYVLRYKWRMRLRCDFSKNLMLVVTCRNKVENSLGIKPDNPQTVCYLHYL